MDTVYHSTGLIRETHTGLRRTPQICVVGLSGPDIHALIYPFVSPPAGHGPPLLQHSSPVDCISIPYIARAYCSLVLTDPGFSGLPVSQCRLHCTVHEGTEMSHPCLYAVMFGMYPKLPAGFPQLLLGPSHLIVHMRSSFWGWASLRLSPLRPTSHSVLFLASLHLR